MAHWLRDRSAVDATLERLCAQAIQIRAYLPAMVLETYGALEALKVSVLQHPKTGRVFLATPGIDSLLKRVAPRSCYRIVEDELGVGASDVLLFRSDNSVTTVHGALSALRAGPDAALLNVLEHGGPIYSPEALSAEAFFSLLARRSRLPTTTDASSFVASATPAMVTLDESHLHEGMHQLRALLGPEGLRFVRTAAGIDVVVRLDDDGLHATELESGAKVVRPIRAFFHADAWTLARRHPSFQWVLCAGRSDDHVDDTLKTHVAIVLGALDDPTIGTRVVEELLRQLSERCRPPQNRSTAPDAEDDEDNDTSDEAAEDEPSPGSEDTSRTAFDNFSSITTPDRLKLIHGILVATGPLKRDIAVREIAINLRDNGYVSFQRFRANGPLGTTIGSTLDSGLRQSWFDRPKRGYVRALIDDLDLDLARFCLVEAVRDSSFATRDEVIRSAFELARERYGLHRTIIHRDGATFSLFRSAINSGIRRGELRASGATLVLGDKIPE